MATVTQVMRELLLARCPNRLKGSALSAFSEKMADGFRAWDNKRHCGQPDMDDPHDREAVEAFVSGAIYIIENCSVC